MSLSPESQALIAAFGNHPGVTPDQIENLLTVLRDSPVLTDRFNEAVAQRSLRQILPLANPHAGADYEEQTKAIRIPLAKLIAPSQASTVGAFHAADLTFVLGHELQHAFNGEAKNGEEEGFRADATRLARSDLVPHDYTALVGRRIDADRRNEASAEIAGWNAVVSSLRNVDASPTLKDIYEAAPGRMLDFIDRSQSFPFTYTLKPNLTRNADLTLSPTPANVEAMGHNYFDKAPGKTRLGHHGNSDYANYYGAHAIGVVASIERQHNPPQRGIAEPIVVDLARLRLSEQLMEENGIDLGRNAQRMPYRDLASPSTLRHFDHTAGTHAHVPITAQALSQNSGTLQVTGMRAQPESHFFPRTATDDYLDACHAALLRNDFDACSALTQQHMQLPHMQERLAWGRQLYEAEQQRLLEEQRRLEEQQRLAEQERQQWQERRQAERARGHAR